MKRRLLAFAVIILVSAFGVTDAGGDKKPAGGEKAKASLSGRFMQLDTGKPPSMKPWTLLAVGGDWVQLHVLCSTEKKEENIRDLRVEVEGDAAAVMAVLTMPVRIELGYEFNAGDDTTRKNLHCLVKAVKKGKSVVRIIPVGEDGKDRPVREIIVHVTKDAQMK